MKWVVQVPLTVIGLDWADGEMVGTPTPVNLHGPIKPDPFTVRLDETSGDETNDR